MKKTLQLIVALLFTSSLAAQDLDIDPGQFEYSFTEESSSQQIGYTITNNSTTDLEWAWKIFRGFGGKRV